jgi:hypothetical protein
VVIRPVALVLISSAAIAWGGLARAQAANLVANPGAESGDTSSWASTGFAAVPYGSFNVPTVPFGLPTTVYSEGNREEVALGKYLFEGGATGASMTQDVSLQGLPPETGGNSLIFGAWLGGSGSGVSGAKTVFQFLNDSQAPIGAPITLGPPSAADRSDETTLLYCRTTAVPVPEGAQTLDVTVTSTGPNGLADEISAAPPGVVSGVEYLPPSSEGWWIWERQTDSSCLRRSYRPAASPSGTPSPSPSPSVKNNGSAPDGQVRLMGLTLSRRRLSVRLSSAATVKITIAQITRSHTWHARKAGKAGRRAIMLRIGGTQWAVAHIAPPLSPGKYELVVKTTGPSGQITATNAVRIVK